MSSDLSSYLATRYLIADPKPSKKRKRSKNPDASSGGGGGGLIIADDDGETGWSRRGHDDDDNEDGVPATVAGTSAEFRKAKKSGWKVVGAPASSSSSTPASAPQQPDDASRAADQIVASAAAELRTATSADDASPALVLMSDGTHAGLQSGAAVSQQLARRRDAERAEYEREARSQSYKQQQQETVYRDATGRRVDVAMKRAELRREAEAAREKQEQERRALRGDAQVAEARARREALGDAALMGVARGADDEDLNRELKGKVRWGDTMAQFIGASNTGGGGKEVTIAAGGKKKSGGGSSGAAKGRQRPTYQGAWAPNRYQIPPGYRWDGVDRSNGFEAERFKAINRRERNKGLEYTWQMDD
ncbi:Pre-mRNA-splicing factor of RES complex-domain-containing protein [Biscogniauxia mediterranea]|nr:Pre-mRNA-splicing factor of RES complex-domain-containing protein [Biscogniauxia mediterranea]